MSNSSYLALPENEKFNGKNYYSFKNIVEMTIGGKGLLGYLDGTIPQPPISYTAINAMNDPNKPLNTLPTTPWNATCM